jgi:ABC-type molybdate transport system substrate-binding protein
MAASNPSYPVIPDERGDDLHGLADIHRAKLVIFMAGNQFMVMTELMAAFQKRHPSISPIYYETLPPKLELNQILAGGAYFRGQLIDVVPDIYTSVSSQAVEILVAKMLADRNKTFPYLHNRIALMVAAGNPMGIETVTDLARKGLRISQPNAAYEDIAAHILAMYRQAGGEQLQRCIMEDKRIRGETLLTTVHHRETPQRILDGQVDVGPVWATEIDHARRSGLPLEGIDVGAELDQRDQVSYFACPITSGRHHQNADRFLSFLTSSAAVRIYRRYGFTPAATGHSK